MIRRFTDQDADRCREIIGRCYDRFFREYEDEVRLFLKKRILQPGFLEAEARKYQILVYEKEGKIVALAGLDKNKLRRLYVDPDCQGAGIGRELLVYREKLVEEAGYDEIYLHTHEDVKGFFEKNGYLEDGIYYFRPKGTGFEIPFVVMRKKVGGNSKFQAPNFK